MRTNSKKVSDLTMWLADRYGKIGREGIEAEFYIRRKCTMADFFRAQNSALWKNHISANTPFTDFAPEAPLKQISGILGL